MCQPGWEGGGREWIHVYGRPSPFASHLKRSQHCQLAIPQYKIKRWKFGGGMHVFRFTLKNNNFNLFIFGCARSALLRRLSVAAESRGHSSRQWEGLSPQWLLLLLSTGSRAFGLQYLQLPGSRAQARELRCTGLVTSRHVGSSWIRDQTRVSCIGRQIPHHWATRETPVAYFWLNRNLHR